MDTWLLWGVVVCLLLLFLATRSSARQYTAKQTTSATMAAPAPRAPRRDFVQAVPAQECTTTERPPALGALADIVSFTGVGGGPIYVAADGFVFDMSSHEGGPAFYGPGGGYSVFAGRDATIGLATMQTDATKWEKTAVAQLTASEKDTLADWVGRFSMKYRIVGYLTDGAAPKSVATHGLGE